MQSLATRLEAGVDEHESLANAVAQLGVRLDEMTWRDDGSATRVEELQEQVQALGATLAEVGQGLAVQADAGAPQRLDELGQSLAAIRDEISTLAQSVTPADRIEQIAHRVEELAAEREARQALGARLEEIESRLTADIVTPEHLARALADARDDLPPAPAPLPDPRVDELTRELASLRDGEEALATKLDDLEHRFPAEIVTPAELANALARTREELASAPSVASDPRVDELSAGLTSLREELAGVRDTRAPTRDDSAVRAEIAALARRIEELPAAEPRHDAPLVARIEALEQRVEAPTVDPVVEQLTQRLTHGLDEVREQVANLERTPVTDPVVASELDTLSQRLRFLDDRLNEDVATSGEVTRAVEAIEALAARVDGLSEVVAPGASDTTGPAAEDLRRLVDERVEAQVAERVAELTRGIEERLAAAESQPRAAGSTGDTTGLEDVLERNRMTIERLGLHLGEHDRVLAELMRSRDLPEKLDELAARVDEIAGGAPAGGAKPAPRTRREIGTFSSSEPSTGEVKALMRRVEDAEVASQADREKLMNRLERMASSIDWRLQRLEAAETAAASSDDD